MTGRVSVVLVVLLAFGTVRADWLPVAGGTGGARVTLLEQNATRTVFEVTIPGLEANAVNVNGEYFTQLSLPGEVMAVIEEGKPQVPKVSVLLGIPTGARVSTRVLDKETKTLAVSNVYPLQPPLTDKQEQEHLVYDRKFYSQDLSFPDYDERVIETGVWRDLSVANIQVYPVRVNPARGTIDVASRIRIEASYSGGSYPRTVADWMVPQYAQYIDNFGQLGLQSSDAYTAGVRYLVISHATYATDPYLVDSLMGWVKKRGYETRLISKSSYTAQEIKDSIRAEYNRNNPKTLRWVLLVGEYAQIPQGSYSGVARSDYWYSDLEPWPSGDNYPEIGISRYSPSSSADLANQIKKTLEYQKNPPQTNNWLDKLSMPAHKEQYPGKYSGCTRGIYFMPKPYWNPSVVETIMGQFTGNATVTAAINQGRNIVAYRGHGDYTIWAGWGTEGNWTNAHVDALANGSMTPVVYNIACNCGDIYQNECLSEKWMRKYPGGAVASLAATQPSYTLPNHGICSTLVRATSDTWTIVGARRYGPTVYNLADIKCYGVDAYVAKYWPSSQYPYNIWMYLMLGDPSMPVWCGGMPQAAMVDGPASIPLGAYDLVISVTVGGRPVEGALVCAWKDPDFYVSGRTDAAGQATLSVNAVDPGDVLVTVSEGHAQSSVPRVQHTPILPYETTIPAGGAPRPSLVYVSSRVLDAPPGGNNNGRLDPGEIAKFEVTLRNAGGADCYNTRGVFSPNDSRLVASDPNGTWGNIPKGASATNTQDPFELQADASILPGTPIPCTLRLTGDTADYQKKIAIILTVGRQPNPPGNTVWGPKVGSGLPSDPGLHGVAYNTSDGSIYCCHYLSASIHKYSSDSALVSRGTIPAPEDSCTDLAYCAYDNTFWVLANASKRVYKISPSGTVLRSFSVPIATYPVGIAEETRSHILYLTDRRLSRQTPGYIYMLDTLGNVLGVLDHPLSGNLGARCLALDAGNPVFPPSLVNIYTWYDTTGTRLDSSGMYELEQGSGALLRGFKFPNAAWDMRGIEYDPRDGTYWVTIMKGGTANDQIIKVSGFNLPVGVAEGNSTLQASRGALEVRPNPFSRAAGILYASSASGRAELVAYDAGGRQVEQAVFEATAGKGRFLWRPKGLIPGIYFLKVRTPGSESVVKVLLLD